MEFKETYYFTLYTDSQQHNHDENVDSRNLAACVYIVKSS